MRHEKGVSADPQKDSVDLHWKRLGGERQKPKKQYWKKHAIGVSEEKV